MNEIIQQLGQIQKRLDKLERDEGFNSDELEARLLTAQGLAIADLRTEMSNLTQVVNQYITIVQNVIEGGGTFTLPEDVLLDSNG